MTTYTTDGRRPVQAENMSEAAAVFADRIAREEYGRRGHARTVNSRGYAPDGSFAEFEAFIGRPDPGWPTATLGRNVFFVVRRKD